MSFVSIIVPCYKLGQSFEQTLGSLTSQTHQAIEIILVDDGDTPPLDVSLTSHLLKDKRIRIIRHEENLGLSNARNTGLRHAIGEHVLFWDADDILHANTIEVLLALALKNKSDIARGVLARSDGIRRWITERGRRISVQKSNTNLQASPELTMDFSSCGVLFSRPFLTQFDPCFEPGLYMQDILFTTKVLLHSNRIAMTDHIVGDYMQSPNSASSLRSENRFVSLFLLYEKLEELFQDIDISKDVRTNILAGFINAGVNTFLLWKLEDHQNNNSDLDKLSALMDSVEEDAINQYCMDMFDEPSYLRLHATRLGEFELAASASNIDVVSNQDITSLYSSSIIEKQRAEAFLNKLKHEREISKTNGRLVLDDANGDSKLMQFTKKIFSKLKI